MVLTALDVRLKVQTTIAARNNHKGAKGLCRDIARNMSVLFVSSRCAIQNSRKATSRRKNENENQAKQVKRNIEARSRNHCGRKKQ
jgi:hypothetical protein